ncbi:ICP22 family protein [Haloarcula brevis]|uniref:hypothetical protein n=1 Tax=Haloarcula brevis TaxID=3111453 RepID=UPI00300E8279
MGLFDTIRRAVGGDGSAADGDERTADDHGSDRLDTATLDPAAFRRYADAVVDGADPLTFDPAALARLDAAVEESYDGETADDADATTYTGNTVRFGSYLGEVLVRAYDGEWVQSGGRWGVTVAGPDDAVTVAVFDVARRSFRDDPVFAAVVTRLESELALDADEGGTAEGDADGPVAEPTGVDDAADEHDAPATDTAERPPEVSETVTEEAADEATPEEAAGGTTADEAAAYIDEAEPALESDATAAADALGDPAVGGNPNQSPEVPPGDGGGDSSPAGNDGVTDSTARPWEPGTVRAAHADTAAEFAEFWGERDLDFSPASLSRLDDLVDAEWDAERFAETTFGSDASFDDRAFTSVVRELGGYFGEVLVRHLDGEWTDATEHEAAVVVTGPAGQFAVPVFQVAMTSLRKQAVFARSYDALLEDLGRDGPAR